MADLNLKIPAINKLVDYVASGIGAVGGPLLARWKANREADAARIEAQGQADVMRIKAQGQGDSMGLIASAQAEARNKFSVADTSIRGKMDIGNEIDLRLIFQEKKRQSNIGSVVGMAADELGNKEVQNHDADHDWVARFFTDVQDVTSEHMQRIWAKILSGEIENPGRTSLYTLSILKNMTQRDAQLFEYVSKFVFNDFVLKDDKYTNKIDQFPKYSNFMELENHGLFHTGSFLQITLHIESERFFSHTDTLYRMLANETPCSIEIPCHVLSKQGQELFRIVGSNISEEYLSVFSKFLYEKKEIKLEKSQIVKRYPEGTVQHSLWVPL